MASSLERSKAYIRETITFGNLLRDRVGAIGLKSPTTCVLENL